MLTGKQAFEGEDITEILAAVVMKKPAFDALPHDTPASVRVLLERCLRKDRHQRLGDAGAVRIEIEDVLAAPTDAGPAWAVVRHQRFLPWIAVAVFLLGSVGLAILHFRAASPADSVLHLSIPLPANTLPGFLALSPDGKRLVIMFAREDKEQLWIRSLDSPQHQLLPGTEFARSPFWSPDGKSIGFFADGKLKIVSAGGGPPQVLCDGTGIGASGTWNGDGVILFSTTGIGDPLQRVNASGGACTVVTKPEGGSTHRYPEFLPDGKHFVFLVLRGDEAKRGLYVASLENLAPRRLLTDESSAVFAPSTTGKKYGYLLFLRGGALMAQPFNTETLRLAGDVFSIASEVDFSFNGDLIAASASPGGILAYVSNRGTQKQLIWLDRSGKELGKVGKIQNQYHVGLSPNEKTVATVRNQVTNSGIWLYDVKRGGETRLTSPALPSAAVWSPDGTWIAFGSGRGLYLKDANGGLREELLVENANTKAPSDWSKDGRYLIYTEEDQKSRGDIWFLADPLNRSGERKPVKFLATEAIESQGQLSPDGRWLAYVSDESGQFEIYVRPFPSGSGRWKISAGRRAGEPRWRRDGKELFFLEIGSPVDRLMAVPVQSGSRGDLQAQDPKVLFEFRSVINTPQMNAFLYSPSADGERFLVNVLAGDTEPTLNVINNWEKAALGSK